ncbi:MAG TPA: ABC transporter permease [Candidatus Limnocylindrales bacterium]|nr:ABC transporter permease [Candidatus Limnocylindrales bacterium]
MQTFIIRRLIQIVLVLLVVTMLVFLLVRLLPGDPILMYMSQQNMEILSQEQIDQIRHEVGIDRNLAVQYIDWLGSALRGDLGKSIINRSDVADEMASRLPISMYLAGIAFIISIIIGIPLGVISAVRRGTWLDTLLTSLGNFGITVPVFWLGILLIYLFGLKLNWLPIFGFTSPFTDFGMSIRQSILPVFCLAVPPIASGIRMTRSSMLEVMRQDYIRTAWSKGLTERTVIISHALKNGLIPVITMKGMSLASIVGGSVIIETVFSIPGMGRLAVEGLFAQDYTVVQGVMLLVGAVVLFANLLVDLSYGWLDPRIRYS